MRGVEAPPVGETKQKERNVIGWDVCKFRPWVELQGVTEISLVGSSVGFTSGRG